MQFNIQFNILVTLAVVVCVMAKDYYKILGLKHGATEKEIKRAFRRLALKFHPDKNHEPDAEEKFRELAEAYEILTNAGSRAHYDNTGETGGGGEHHYHYDGHANFDMNEFFKQFEESFDRHRSGGQRSGGSKGGFFNFDDLWDDDFDADDFWKEFDFDTFKFGNTFDAHQQKHAFDHARAHARNRAVNEGRMNAQLNGESQGMFGDFEEFGVHTMGGHSHSEQQTCHTVTTKVGDSVMTQTTCTGP